MAAAVSVLWLSITAVLSPFLSIVIFSGVPFRLIAWARTAVRLCDPVWRSVENPPWCRPYRRPDTGTSMRLSPEHRSRPFASWDLPGACACGVVHLNAVLLHHFLELAVADRIRHIPADCPEDNVPLEVTALELDHRMLAVETLARKRTPGASVKQIYDRTHRGRGTAAAVPFFM
jgi:hypothetical protein